MNELRQMGYAAAINLLANHEQAGTLVDYISEIAPEFIHNGEVQKFQLLDALEE